jgi:peptide/nickel transport system substrate-binding protein
MLDPALATDADSRTVIGYVYEGLVKMDNNTPAPALASSWTVSGDGLDYIFNLQAGATFHDGSPVNADAVIANFNRWFDPSDPNHGSGKYDTWVSDFLGFKGKSSFDGIEKVNESTVILHLNTPDPNLLQNLTDPAFSIVSPSALSAAGFGTQTGKDGGTGAYKLGAWTDSSLTLEPASSAASANIVFTLK